MTSLLILSSALLQLAHPLTLGLILISSAILTGSFLSLLRSSWFFYLLILVFLGGVIILIIYIVTLSANKKFTAPSNLKTTIIIFLGLPIILNIRYRHSRISSSDYGSPALFIYEHAQLPALEILMLYLLLTLVCVVKLVKFESGPLVRRL